MNTTDTPSDEAQVHYLSVGIPAGIAPWSTTGEPSGAVRLGTAYHYLSPDSYRAWLVGLDAPTVSEFVENIAFLSREVLDDTIRDFLKRGLLAQIGVSEDRDSAFLAHHKLMPVGFGAGAASTRPDRFAIAGPDMTERAQVDPLLYGIWIASDGCASGIAACAAAAAAARLDPNAMTRHLAINLPVLMRGHLVLVDSVDALDAL